MGRQILDENDSMVGSATAMDAVVQLRVLSEILDM